MYQGWYNIYEGRKVSRVAMCEVKSKKKQQRTNQIYIYINSGLQWKKMDCDELHLTLNEKT